ncbi:MAG: FKBP-type peptidyl-prolyl cis-trans isomerase [Muribaculaceae bacterium]|nr:FKBP-type peptidyl-prolyl cis-trans isomerase [Muribaculaceae bacterium]
MNIKKYLSLAAAALIISPLVTSCLGNDDKSYDYTDWIYQNETYMTRMEDTVANGKKVYEKISPVWAPGVYILAQWHNDRSLTASKLVPMDNSTCEVVYEGYYVNGTLLDASYNHSSDSIYSCKPNQMIVGFWTMLTNMHVGDSVTCVIPTTAAYGASSTRVVPYSTLIYNLKLKAISAYEVSKK